jgi:alpha-beta hydrolase superfamily lysophospholipase
MKRFVLHSATVVVLLSKLSFAQDLPRSASFGTLVYDLNDSVRSALKLGSLSGTYVKMVVPGSSAQKAGIMPNDVIISLDGQPIENTGRFLELLKKHHGGDKVLIGYYRHGKLSKATVNLMPKPMEKSDDYDIIYSSVVSGANQLRTIITKPKGTGVHPAVLLIGGVGCYSVDNPTVTEILSMKMWADSLAENGFVAMRVEKTGIGDSKGLPCKDCDFNTEKQGYLDGLKQLKSLPYVSKENTFIAGFSIGGVIAPLIAQQEPVKGIIVYGTVGRNWLEYELENTSRQQLLDDRRADSIDMYMRADYIRLYGLFVEKKQPEQILKEHPETAGHLFSYPMRIEYFQQVADVNIRELWMNTKAKVLAIHGSSDFVSSAKEHEMIAETVNHYHPGNASYVEIPNSDHWSLLTESELISSLHQSSELNSRPLKTSIEWLKTNS